MRAFRSVQQADAGYFAGSISPAAEAIVIDFARINTSPYSLIIKHYIIKYLTRNNKKVKTHVFLGNNMAE